MAIVQEIGKKLVIAGVSGALILGFVYIKDKYLNQETTDIEELHALDVIKDETPVQKSSNEPKAPMSITVKTPTQQVSPLNSNDSEPKIIEEKDTKLSEFEKYKQSQISTLENDINKNQPNNYVNQQSNNAQNELEKEMANY